MASKMTSYSRVDDILYKDEVETSDNEPEIDLDEAIALTDQLATSDQATPAGSLSDRMKRDL